MWVDSSRRVTERRLNGSAGNLGDVVVWDALVL